MFRYMKIVTDYPTPYHGYACDDQTEAALADPHTGSPRLILCDRALEDYGGIEKDYTGAPAVTCDSIGDTMSNRMATMGSTLLHEYTHWQSLMVPPLDMATTDMPNAYGAWGASHVQPKTDAIYNADTYSHYAMEVFWTNHCGHRFDNAVFDPDYYCL
ncbi:hypothetical protein N7495_001018 [Penicillium taxi]|uniref:uncharacterized protein n=1 Tax=Penicillium taxi TaxID=168475 RepID=UPI002544EE3B|nr:uncharacterized protein N7495_001018 [Penicillium taxi]KAJ5908336.1 hypothetical protein N7495_001018 [Penicillium taxi]